tara:strand:- start:1518 stop:1742 length:225 start_codon:yes stop_codon:yes gene_type:complete
MDMGNVFGNYATLQAAEDELLASGYTRKVRDGRVLFSKPGKVDDWYGGYIIVGLVVVEQRPLRDGGCYYQHHYL